MSSVTGYCCDQASLPPMPLTMSAAGQWVRVAGVCGCGAAERLADMGLIEGCRLQVVRPSAGGPVMICLKGARLALGRGLAGKILVQPLADDPADAPEPRAFPVSA